MRSDSAVCFVAEKVEFLEHCSFLTDFKTGRNVDLHHPHDPGGPGVKVPLVDEPEEHLVELGDEELALLHAVERDHHGASERHAKDESSEELAH